MALGPDPVVLLWMSGLEMQLPLVGSRVGVLSALPMAGLGGNKGIDAFAALFWITLSMEEDGMN